MTAPYVNVVRPRAIASAGSEPFAADAAPGPGDEPQDRDEEEAAADGAQHRVAEVERRRRRSGRERPAPSRGGASMPRASQAAAATIERLIQPSVPEWTCVRSWSWLNSTRSSPLRMPMTIVTMKTAIATR